jgi:tRNA(fMet)-specific endonuclease VapC
VYALDTNTLIYFFKGQGNVAKNLFRHPPKRIFIPAIVAYEICVGIEKSTQPKKRRQQWEEILALCKLCPFTYKEGQRAAQIRHYLEKKGKSIGPLDTLIAGTCLANGLTLVTHNTKEFKRVKGLNLEDWY